MVRIICLPNMKKELTIQLKRILNEYKQTLKKMARCHISQQLEYKVEILGRLIKCGCVKIDEIGSKLAKRQGCEFSPTIFDDAFCAIENQISGLLTV
ncbi:hypothetical protein ISS03_00915 [Patescibacteria group bacterium]|nr:hypothetical protein [Patescibacteria group bacterium]